VILLDTSGLLAAIDAAQHHHAETVSAMRRAQGPRLLSPFVLAELNYLLATRVGQEAELALLSEVARGAYRLEPFGPEDVAAAHQVIERYGDLHIGLADASIVVLAARYDVHDVLTLDRRHFAVLRGFRGRRFRIIP